MAKFTHLHVHSQYSILDGAASISGLINRAKELSMNALAITDHGNLYGVFDFHTMALKNGIKPLIGSEVYVARESRFKKDGRNFSGDHLILIAKNAKGYQNLMKLSSLSFDPKSFYRTSRIDKELLFEYSEGLICSSACLGGIVPQYILSNNIEDAEKTVQEYKSVFGDDYYLEIQNHGLEEQAMVKEKIIEIAKKYEVKVIATNDVHYINSTDFDAHKILICLNTGQKLSEYSKMHYTGLEYFKSQEEMEELFADIPEAISNTQEIVDKVEEYPLKRDPILPVFDIPNSFGLIEDFIKKYPKEEIEKELSEEEITKKGGYEKIIRTRFEFEYLKHLTFNGAKKKYGEELSDELIERIDFELSTINNMGYPGYFLIVQDFINYSQDHLGVIVGPGRGSAAGSVVAYCLGITAIDPIKYGLLFERFLNPDRVSLPDVDVDFDDEGRARVLEYVQEKYGSAHVAQIITFGAMAAKSSIRDVARVLELPLPESDRLAKLVPDKPGTTLEEAYKDVPELRDALENGTELVKKTLKFAKELEGSIRNIGTHACGVIIGPDDLSKYIPLATATAKDEQSIITQFEGKIVEDVGMIKMDFLGLKTLSIIKDACANIQKSHQIHINPREIPLDDKPTFELFQRGDSIGTFQFESDGMRQHMQNLKPDRFEDLIAMNALYRPGPMQYIPNYIARKHKREKIVYDIPEIMEKYLGETYGITVYQEQVMQLSQAIAGFTKGQADTLRKAMGKKQKKDMDVLKEKFLDGSKERGHDKDLIEKIWHDWEKFAEYAFNKSHSTCYAYIAYQTAWLKAHYPADFMSSVLTHNLSDIKKITYYIEEAQRLKISVQGPDINESEINFAVNKKGEIRFGLAAIKSVGVNAAQEIIRERDENGPFLSPFDFIRRVNVNKRCIEALVSAGSFDSFTKYHRAQYFNKVKTANNDEITIIEKLVIYGNKIKNNENSSQVSLFEDSIEETYAEPEIPNCIEWSKIEILKQEKESIGFYISGHPLDRFTLEQKLFENTKLSELSESLTPFENKILYFTGTITNAQEKLSKTGKNYGSLVFEDETGNREIALFGKDFINFHKFLIDGLFVLIKATVKKRGWGDDNSKDILEFKILQIEALNELLDKYGKGIKLVLPIENLNSEFVEKITKAAKKSKGNAVVSFFIIDSEDDIEVTLKARKHKVSIPKFLDEIKELLDNRTIYSFEVDKSTI
ncbi:MAG: DNA polymerase III subunit alpha [Bacteroidales bacterium]|nr:DNA polymerase III subunit alpha [Bacteroidales bacterium]